MPEPPASDGSVRVRTLLIRIRGTHHEIAVDGYGVPPPGEERLVLGHESLAPGDYGLACLPIKLVGADGARARTARRAWD